MKFSQTILGAALVVTSASAQGVQLVQPHTPQCDAGSAWEGIVNATACPTPIKDHLAAVCYPNGTSGPDYNAPCNAVALIQNQCIYGTDPGLKAGQDIINSINKRDDGSGTPQLSNSTQRQCICESQFFDATKGCAACFSKHGATANLPEDVTPGFSEEFNPADFDAMSRSYCAVSATPTINLAQALYNIAISADQSATLDQTAVQADASTTLTLSDPLGNKTDVSLYYTPTVTGKAFWCPAIPTGSPSTSNGQIVAATAATGSCTDVAAATSATKSSGADRLTVVGGGVLMVLGGLVAVL